jgi:hypothetical protein
MKAMHAMLLAYGLLFLLIWLIWWMAWLKHRAYCLLEAGQ